MGQPPDTGTSSPVSPVPEEIVAAYEGPQGSTPGAGVGLLRAWAFSAAGEAISTVPVVRLGSATYADQFDLSGATAEIVGEELILWD